MNTNNNTIFSKKVKKISNEKLSHDVHTILKGQMTRAMFDNTIKGSWFELHSDTLNVFTHKKQAYEWMKAKLTENIQNACKSVVGYPVTLVFQPPIIPEDNNLEGELIGFDEGDYHLDYNKIVKPNKQEWSTRYFATKWRPKLKPTLSELIRELRYHCNKSTGRNTFVTTIAKLAENTGINERTIHRYLERDEETKEFKKEYVGLFIKKIKTIYKYNPKNKKNEKRGLRFTMYLDEPLLSEDKEILDKLI